MHNGNHRQLPAGFSEGVNKPTMRMTSEENDFIHVHAKSHAKKKPLLAGRLSQKASPPLQLTPKHHKAATKGKRKDKHSLIYLRS